MYIQGKINIWKCYRRCILMFPCLFACSGNVVRSTVPPRGDKVPKPLTNLMKLMNMNEDLFPTLKVFKLAHPNRLTSWLWTADYSRPIINHVTPPGKKRVNI